MFGSQEKPLSLQRNTKTYNYEEDSVHYRVVEGEVL